MNVAISPLWLHAFLTLELKRTGLSIEDPRFKKVREEILPAVDYVLFLKMVGHGEHFISSSDSPDIILTPKENSLVAGTAYKRRAIPIEVTTINDDALLSASGADSEEKIVSILEKKKLGKAYSPHTTLLVTVNA